MLSGEKSEDHQAELDGLIASLVKITGLANKVGKEGGLSMRAFRYHRGRQSRCC
jgi:hypothetical protein